MISADEILSPEELECVDLEYSRFTASRDLVESDSPQFRVERIAGATLVIIPPRAKSSPPCRLIGLSPESLPQLDEMLAVFAEIKTIPQIEVSAEDMAADVAEALTLRGFGIDYAINYMVARPSLVSTSNIRIERWGPDRVELFLELLQTSGVSRTPEIDAWRLQNYCTDTLRVFTAELDGQPRAWATCFVSHELGFFANAFTQPEFRGLGCQHALLSGRLADAHALGLKGLVTDVVPRTASQRNCERVGFRISKTQTIWTEC